MRIFYTPPGPPSPKSVENVQKFGGQKSAKNTLFSTLSWFYQMDYNSTPGLLKPQRKGIWAQKTFRVQICTQIHAIWIIFGE